MEIYIVLWLIICFCSLCSTFCNVSKLTESTMFILILVSLVTIQGIRASTVGGDLYDHYAYDFIYYGVSSWESLFDYYGRRELGYILFNKIIYILSNGNLQVLLLCIALFYHCAIGKFVYKYSDNIIVSILTFLSLNLFNASMNNLRSTIALSFFILALGKLIEKKYIIFIFFFVTALFFHRTIFLFVPFIVLYFLKSIKSIVAFIVIYLLCGFYGFHVMTNLLVEYMPYYSYYFVDDLSGAGYGLLTFLLIILFGILLFAKKEFFTEFHVIMMKMFLCGIILQLCSLEISYMARAVYYHMMALIILLPNLLYQNRLYKYNKTMIIPLVLMFGVFYLYSLFVNASQTVPYKVF